MKHMATTATRNEVETQILTPQACGFLTKLAREFESRRREQRFSHFIARTDDVTLVREGREIAVTTVEHADGERPWAVLATETPGARPAFRAVGTRVIPMAADRIGITDDARRRLAVEDGQRVWLCFG